MKDILNDQEAVNIIVIMLITAIVIIAVKLSLMQDSIENDIKNIKRKINQK